MSMSAGRAVLQGSFKDLLLRWGEARGAWDDPTSRDFEKEFLDPLEPRIKAALSAMEHMAGLLETAKRDCADRAEG